MLACGMPIGSLQGSAALVMGVKELTDALVAQAAAWVLRRGGRGVHADFQPFAFLYDSGVRTSGLPLVLRLKLARMVMTAGSRAMLLPPSASSDVNGPSSLIWTSGGTPMAR